MRTSLKRRVAARLVAIWAAASTGRAADGAESGASVAALDGAAVLVLPVEGALDTDALHARLLIALQRRGRRALSLDDVPEARRGALPADPARCLAPDCVRRLADASGAARVLAVRFLDDGGRAAVFATLFDAARGRVLRRDEVGRADWPAAALAEEIARWERGEPPPPPPVGSRPIPAPLPPLVAVDVVAPGTPEARALAAALVAELTRFQTFGVAPGDPPRATHRALVWVDHASVVARAHHVHRYRTGLLTATVAITDLRTGARVFQSRAHAALDERERDESDAQAMARLEASALDEWMTKFRADAVERVLARRP